MSGFMSSVGRMFHRGVTPAVDATHAGVAAVAANAPRQSLFARMCQCLRLPAFAARARVPDVAARRRSSVVSLVRAEGAANQRAADDHPVVIHVTAPDEPSVSKSAPNSLSETPDSSASADRDLDSILADSVRRTNFINFSQTKENVQLVLLSREFSLKTTAASRKLAILECVFADGFLGKVNIAGDLLASLETQWLDNPKNVNDCRWLVFLHDAEVGITHSLRDRVRPFLSKELLIGLKGDYRPAGLSSSLTAAALKWGEINWAERSKTPSPHTPESKSPT